MSPDDLSPLISYLNDEESTTFSPLSNPLPPARRVPKLHLKLDEDVELPSPTSITALSPRYRPPSPPQREDKNGGDCTYDLLLMNCATLLFDPTTSAIADESILLMDASLNLEGENTAASRGQKRRMKKKCATHTPPPSTTTITTSSASLFFDTNLKPLETPKTAATKTPTISLEEAAIEAVTNTNKLLLKSSPKSRDSSLGSIFGGAMRRVKNSSPTPIASPPTPTLPKHLHGFNDENSKNDCSRPVAGARMSPYATPLTNLKKMKNRAANKKSTPKKTNCDPVALNAKYKKMQMRTKK